jgi:hypothetical protein
MWNSGDGTVARLLVSAHLLASALLAWSESVPYLLRPVFPRMNANFGPRVLNFIENDIQRERDETKNYSKETFWTHA